MAWRSPLGPDKSEWWQQRLRARVVAQHDVDPVLAASTWPTIVLGEEHGFAQISVLPIPDDPHAVYCGLTWVPPEHRGQGHAGAALRALVALAEEERCVLYVHPNTPDMEARLLDAYGFSPAPEMGSWNDSPCLVRRIPVDTLAR